MRSLISRIIGIAAVVATASFAALLSGCGESEPVGRQQLTIVYSNDMKGEIRSCGCVSNDNGGLGRRATFVDMQRRGAQNFMIFEGGDLFAEGLNYGKEKADLTLQSMRAMHYTAAVVGEGDLLYGVDFLKERSEALNIPFLSANLIDIATDKLVFPPTEIVRLPSGLLVGVIGVLAGVELPEAAPADRLKLSSARAAIERHTSRLRDKEKVDLVIVLAHMPNSRLRQVARALEGVDIIIAGHDARPSRKVSKIGRAWVLESSDRGRYMGVARGEIDENGRIAYFNSDLQALTKEYEDHESITKLFMTYDMDVRRQEEGKKGLPAGYAARRFAGDKACQSCHPAVYEHWKGTKHAHAFDILTEKDRQYDRDCTPCHTAGFYELGGFLSVTDTPGLTHVQCESCHGNSAEHVSDPTLKTPARARTICTTCHTADQTPGFDFETHWPVVKHPAEQPLQQAPGQTGH